MRTLAKFFSLTFAVTWIAWLAAERLPAAVRPPVVLLGVFAPAIVALALTTIDEGRAAAWDLVRRIGRWRVPARYYALAVGCMASVKLIVAAILRLKTGAWPRFGETSLPLMAMAIATSTWAQAGEEIGWRGYALPRLAERLRLGPASIVLGVIWSVWHLPLFFILGGDTVGQSFPLYALQVTAISVVLAWLYWRTSGSLLLVMLMHAAINNTKDIVPSAAAVAGNSFATMGTVQGQLTVLILWLAAAYLLTRMPRCLPIALLVVAGCAPHRAAFPLRGFSAAGAFGEQMRTVTLDSGVTATIVAPAVLDPGRRIDLILYALPNGNSTAQTMGRRMTDGLDWHYDIQHIAAQTRALRERGLPQAVVVYLEANTKSWPEWRRVRGYEVANARIVTMVDRLRAMFPSPNLAVTLTGHSGGGSFMFGYIEGQAAIPDWLERIAFLDANYNFEAKHGDKLAAWLRRDPSHTLVSIAYDDREIMLDGKKVVSDDGGTWRASHRMIDDLGRSFPLVPDTLGEFARYHDAQIELLVHPNPANRILHTELVGEMNGYMHAMLVRRPEYARGETVLRRARAYTRFVE